MQTSSKFVLKAIAHIRGIAAVLAKHRQLHWLTHYILGYRIVGGTMQMPRIGSEGFSNFYEPQCPLMSISIIGRLIGHWLLGVNIQCLSN